MSWTDQFRDHIAHLPPNIILRNGQLHRRHEGEYKQVVNAPPLVYGSCYDNKTAVTVGGGLYLLDKNMVIELVGIKIVKCVPSIAREIDSLVGWTPVDVVRRFLVLTDNGIVYAIHLHLKDKVTVKLLKRDVQILMGLRTCAIYNRSGKWEFIGYYVDRYKIHQARGHLPEVNEHFNYIGDVCVNDKGIHYIIDESRNGSRAVFKLAPHTDNCKMACRLLSRGKDNHVIVGLQPDGRLFDYRSLYEGWSTGRDNYKSGIVELMVFNYKCYALSSDYKLYIHRLERTLFIQDMIDTKIPRRIIKQMR